ncbi:MAG: KamA family radical SAM protein [Candidatus Omnitrophica bacterium]|nr:KamA family radical SAM protein [Candidatus Omnitrophota bacterium]MBU4333106.1 KamA family radical SAM protein [Candidatus Omnitrophota bacterium]
MANKLQTLSDERNSDRGDGNDEGSSSDSGEPPDPGGATFEITYLALQDFERTFRLPSFNKTRLKFPISEKTRKFIAAFYPDISFEQWSDWKWQVSNRILRVEQLEKILHLTAMERRAIIKKTESLPIAITPYYMSLFSRDDYLQPIRKTHIPWEEDPLSVSGEKIDPLGEDHHMVVPGLVHRYPDRVLFLVTGFCSTYCRYCTRSRMVGETSGEYSFSVSQWEGAIQYIKEHTEVRDCLISGGDPLSLGDEQLNWLLTKLRSIKHLEFIRIGTKIPVVMPQRVTRELCSILKKFHPLWMSIHFTHPDELTKETIEACTRLADAGIPLGSQTVLLKGINDNVETLKTLFHGLIKTRVKPYYLYQCDPVSGFANFRTPVEKGLEIIRQLRGHTTGYSIPQYVIDAPGGGGKIPLQPDYVFGREGEELLLTNFEGKIFRYPDPGGRVGWLQNKSRLEGVNYDQSSGVYIQ